MTKHTPATPLPWRRAPQSRGAHRLLAGDKLVGEASHYNEGAYENAAYIAHTANAYPRLVEALRGMVDVADTLGGNAPEILWRQAEASRALLRELGEE